MNARSHQQWEFDAEATGPMPRAMRRAKRDALWPIGESLSVLLALMMCFYLGVLLTMLGYQSGWLVLIP